MSFLLSGLCLAIHAVTMGAPGETAGRDAETRLVAGPSHPIPSRFADLPLVEPHVSAHPARPGQLLVAAMVVTDPTRPYQSCRLVTFSTKDGGEHWVETVHDWWGYDPWTEILPDGRTVLSWIGTPGGFEDRYPVALLSSEDGGETWGSEVQTFAGNHDGTKLVARDADIYLATVRFLAGMGVDVVLSRAGGAGPFRQVARIDGRGQRMGFCVPAILKSGVVVVPFFLQGQEAWVQSYDPASEALGDRYRVSGNPGGGRGYPCLVAGSEDELYYVRALGGAAGVSLNVSRNRGRTWSGDLRIDHFDAGRVTSPLVATAAIGEAGELGVAWVDDPEGDGERSVYFALSRDQARSFTDPLEVSEVQSDPRTSANKDVARRFPGGGHYMGLVALVGGGFQVVWSDSRTGPFQLRTRSLAH